jgi:plastocyanin
MAAPKPPILWILAIALVAIVMLVLWNRQAAAPDAAPGVSTMHVRVNMRNHAFDPPELTVPVGTTVDWIDVEGKHGVQFDEMGASGDREDAVDVGGSISRTFATPGRYPYHCVVHGGPGGQGMAGVVIVAQ